MIVMTAPCGGPTSWRNNLSSELYSTTVLSLSDHRVAAKTDLVGACVGPRAWLLPMLGGAAAPRLNPRSYLFPSHHGPTSMEL
ncbi:hypothetical protein V6N12_000412 [Hibiscus sabdariffa]|uniref:Uncharacterized protein n=1 Tax=Hibiscus sabdariffa TaxID=183260 RepID=A0ABR2BK07_9ROSI